MAFKILRLKIKKTILQFARILRIIDKNTYKEKKGRINSKIENIRSKVSIDDSDRREFIEYVLNQQLDKSNFVPLSEEKYERKEGDPKLISFYLPQFHDFKENVKWFGRGFSEWSNSSKALPQWTGHYQPHLPIDVGFYSLEHIDIMKRQIELAKQYGIYGFCFYYYWYSGNKIMEQPIQKFLADKSLDMPFFFFWANEDWTRLWGEGKEREVLFKQELKDGDDEKFIADILPYMKDERYIKVKNKPMLIIYQPKIFPKERFLRFVKKLRETAKENGFDDVYLLAIRKIGINREVLEELDLNGAVEFYPCDLPPQLKKKKEKIINKEAVVTSWDIGKYIREKGYMDNPDFNLFKGCFPNWDNVPRKCYSGAYVFQNTPEDYMTWLSDLIEWTRKNKEADEQFIFINAWNEWAESAHLEPDRKYGYAYLQATKEALETGRISAASSDELTENKKDNNGQK